MNAAFHNRAHAGLLLAPWLRSFAGRLDTVVVGLPRGGVPVAYQVARKLCVALDILVARKVGVPGEPEVAMGAVAPGMVTVRNDDVLAAHHLTPEQFEILASLERSTLVARERTLRAGRPAIDLTDQQVILVDDGIATGATMRAAIYSARQRGAAAVIVATPVAARDVVTQLQRDADDVVTVLSPEYLFAVGEFYQQFDPVSDREIVELLTAAAIRGAVEAECHLPETMRCSP